MRPFTLMLALEAGKKILPVAREGAATLAERHSPELAAKIRPRPKKAGLFERHVYQKLVTPRSKADRTLRQIPRHPFVLAAQEWVVGSLASRLGQTRLGKLDKVGLIPAMVLQHRVEAMKKVGQWVAVKSTHQAGRHFTRQVSDVWRNRNK